MESEKWLEIKNIFHDALDIEETRRDDFLRRSCSDSDIRSEVERLLAAHGEAEDFIETPAAAVSDVFETANSNPPKKFGNYKVVREIGRGGMGSVYLAVRADDQFNKRVAVKLLRRGMDSEDILKRFRNEERILAALEHPFIARLLDAGISDDNLPYFVMEYIEGEPLDKYCDEHNLTTTERLELFRKVCSAVQYAHQNLIVHRDLKPGNILVTAKGEPKLLDFGIAKLLNPELTSNTIAPTATFVRLMTPDYASPEQIRGRNITTASDTYSLGILLYKILTGQSPYKFQDSSPQEIERVVCESEPNKPSAAQSSKLKAQRSKDENPKDENPKDKIQKTKSLKGDLDNIVLMALRKEPSRRYHSVEAFSDDIERHLKGLPVAARSNTLSYRASKFIKRHKIGIAAAGLILLSLISGIVVSLRQVRIAQREKNKAEVINKFLQGLLSASNPETDLSRMKDHDTTIKELLDKASTKLETDDLSNQPEVKAELQKIIGLSYLTQGQYDSATKNLDAAIDAQKKIYGENSPETLETLVLIADLWINQGKYAEADKFYRQRISILRAGQQQNAGETDILFTALYDFALLRRGQGDSKEAETLVREALDLRPQTSSEMKNSVSIAESVLALTLADQGNFDEAEKIVRPKLTEMRRQTNIETAEFCSSLTMFASILTEKGEYDEAENNLLEAETIYRKLYRETYLPLGDNLRIQAQTLYFQNKLSEAEAKINECLEIYKQVTSRQYANYATGLVIQGLILNKTARAVEAEKVLREAVRIRTENLPKEHFWVALAKSALGECLTDQKRFAEAAPLLTESYEDLKNSQGAENPRTVLAHSRLIKLYQSQGKPLPE